MTTRQQRHPFVEKIAKDLGLEPEVRYDVGVLRISSPGANDKLADQHHTNITAFSHLPDYQALGALDDDITQRGWMQITLADLNPDASRRHVGWVGLVGQTIFLAVTNSAREDNLPAHPSDPAGQGRNAFSDALVAVAIAGNAACIRVASFNRLWRDNKHGNDALAGIAKQVPGCKIFVGNEERAIQGSGAIITTFEGHQSAQYVEAFQEQTFEKRYQHLTAGGQWERACHELPLGLRRARRDVGDGIIKVTRTVEVHADMRAVVVWALETRAAGGTWTEIGNGFAERGVLRRGSRGKGKTFATFKEPAQRAKAARRIITNGLEYYRTGGWIEHRSISLSREQIRGIPLEYEPETGRRFIDIPITGMPWTPFLTDDEWAKFDELEATYEQERARVSGRAAACRSGDVSALRGVPIWTVDELEHGLFPSQMTSYQWKIREPQEECFSRQSGVTEATLQRVLVHRALGNALLASLATIDAPLAPITPTEPAPRDGLADEIASVEERLAVQTRISKRADDEVIASDGDDDEVAHWRDQGREARASIKKLTVELERLRARAADGPLVDVIDTVEADITEPLLVASLLRDGTKQVSPLVAQLLDGYGITGSLRAAWHPEDSGVVRLTATARIPLADGTRHRLDLAWDVVDSKDKSRDTALVAFAVRRWARGDSFATIVDHFPDWTEARALKSLRAALVAHGVRRPLAASVLDTPSMSVRAAIGALVLDDPTLAEHLDEAYRAQVADAYLVAGTNPTITHWAETHDLDDIRRSLRVLAATGTWLTIEDLAARAGVTEALVALMRTTKVIEFMRAVPSRRVRPRVCGHGCGTVLTEYLPTPETGSGLLCTTCRRAGDSTHPAVLPDEYFELAATTVEEDDDLTDLLFSSEAAHHLGLSFAGFTGLVARGAVVPARRVGRRAGLFRLEDLDALPADRLAYWRSRWGDNIADGLLSSGEAGRILGHNASTISDLARSGELPVAGTKGRNRRFARSDLEAFLAARDASL